MRINTSRGHLLLQCSDNDLFCGKFRQAKTQRQVNAFIHIWDFHPAQSPKVTFGNNLPGVASLLINVSGS